VTCPSGQRLKIRIPGIATLLEHGDLPDDLLDIALLELAHADGAAGALASQVQQADTPEAQAEALERLQAFGRFQRELVCAAVVGLEGELGWTDITLTLADLDVLPEDDLAMVAEIVQRLRATDARGVRIGVEPLDRWAMFREAHGCPGEGCEGCQKIVDVFSSSDVGGV
jgi:hypothetical protein